jgi:hypothetical protein
MRQAILNDAANFLVGHGGDEEAKLSRALHGLCGLETVISGILGDDCFRFKLMHVYLHGKKMKGCCERCFEGGVKLFGTTKKKDRSRNRYFLYASTARLGHV